MKKVSYTCFDIFISILKRVTFCRRSDIRRKGYQPNTTQTLKLRKPSHLERQKTPFVLTKGQVLLLMTGQVISSMLLRKRARNECLENLLSIGIMIVCFFRGLGLVTSSIKNKSFENEFESYFRRSL